MKYFLLALIAATLVACSESGTNSKTSYTEKLTGMIQLPSNGQLVWLDKLSAWFSYDFWLGEHEVTCGEVRELSDEQWGSFAKCKSEEDQSYPIDSVSYYDAVYFANAKSRSLGLDTVYTYTKANFDSQGHCDGMDNLKTNFNVNGFRLPTEMEWTYAALRNWNSLDSWNSENSDYTTHPVCTQKRNSDGFCDLAGNVAEWTNDWLRVLDDVSVINFVGAPSSATGERVIKGGSYRNDIRALIVSSRTDVYAVTSSTRREYIGFRLAFGKIPNPVMISGEAGSEYEAEIRADAQSIKSITGSYKNKLVFRNHLTGNLNYVDFFDGGELVAVEFKDSVEAFHPDISPDGSKVAFCTSMEGSDKPSKLYVRNLDVNHKELVQLDVESAAVPRWRVTDGGDTVIVYVSSAGDNSDEAKFMGKSTWQVSFSNGKFGAPQKLFDGAYHGGVSADGRLAVTGSTKLRAHLEPAAATDAVPAAATDAVIAAALDTIWYNAEQACNVSLSQDGTNRTLFLDFASATGRAFVGSKYSVHGRMFLADSTGELIDAIPSPKGYTFDHTEWTLHTDNSVANKLIVASLTNINGEHEKIALVDLADSSVYEIASGDELWHPCFWTKDAPGGSSSGNPGGSSGEFQLDMDSAGVYLSKDHENYAATVRVKMEIFWKNVHDSRVVVVGSSRSRSGVDPDLYPEWKMINLSVLGLDAHRELYMIENYVLNLVDSLKAVVVSLDLDGWNARTDYLAPFKNRYVGYEYDERHDFWKNGIPKGFVEAVENSYPAEKAVQDEYTARGGFSLEAAGWESEPVSVYSDSVFTVQEQQFLDHYLNCLMSLADVAAQKNVALIGVVFPQAPGYKNTGSFGKYGLQRSLAEKKIAWLDSMAREKDYFVLMDENKMGDHDYPDSMANNMDHLSAAGAKQLTTRLVKVLEQLE